MTTPSAAITVNGSAVTGAVAVLRNTTVNLSLVSASGVDSVAWELGTPSESGLAIPTVTPAGTPALAASFPIADRHNQSFGLTTTVNRGRPDEAVSYTVIGVINERGLVPILPLESAHRGTEGWAYDLNRALRPWYSLRFTSTNNTDTTRLTIPLDTDEQTIFDVIATARDQTTNTDTFAKRWQVYARRNASGIVVVVSESTPFPNEAIDASWTCTAVSDGATNLLIKFKGDATNNVLAYVSANPIHRVR